MNRKARIGSGTAVLILAFAGNLRLLEPARGDETPSRDIPAAFLPFEYLVGRWNGQGVPKDPGAQQFRGWSESHSWAWIFTQVKPSGLAVAIQGGKVLATGKLT
jgi:hypothetical protein